MNFTFEWDEKKSVTNLKKHGIGFDEAKTIFNDPSALTIYDPDHSIEEDRFIDIGLSGKGRLLVLSYTEREDTIRIISCRKATSKEIEYYEKRER